MALCLLVGIYLLLTMVLIARDGVFYIDQARRLPYTPAAVAQRHPPGYPFLIWAAHEVVARLAQNDSAMLWAFSAQGVSLLCRVLALIPLYFLGRMLVGARDSFWALLILILLPYPAQYGSDALREWPYLLFLSLGFYLLFWGLHTRRWWVLPLVGLDAGLGYLIRPECAQLVLYGLLGLACCGFGAAERGADEILMRAPREAYHVKRQRRLHYVSRNALWVFAGLLLMAGFAVTVGFYVRATGSIVSRQLRPLFFNGPPVIEAVGSQAATGGLLEFEVRAGELLELPIEAVDPDGDSLRFSVVSVPVGTRPVYQFQSSNTGALFWTSSDRERKVLLGIDSGGAWDYRGIVFYAYGEYRPGVGLKPVRRFWSPTRTRHFYTISSLEKEAILKEPLPDRWDYEGVVFYAFAEDSHPPDAVPVYRFWSEERGYFWALSEPGQDPACIARDGTAAEGVAWYARVASGPPAGAVLEKKTFRWRPGPDSRGDHQLNIIVGDGQLQSCQLVRIHVATGSGPASRTDALSEVQRAGIAKLPEAAGEVFDAVAEDLMVFFLVPWALGLYHRLRHEAGRLERVLMVAVVVVSLGLMLTRYAWVQPGSNRRYSLGLVVLSACYIPTGLTIMSAWLGRAFGPRGERDTPAGRRSPWFFILVSVGLGICVVRLLPPDADKIAYRAAAAWLRENTQLDDVVAVSDSRIGFYAERRMVIYERDPDTRKADYVVSIGAADPGPALNDCREVHSLAATRKGGKALTIYRTARQRVTGDK